MKKILEYIAVLFLILGCNSVYLVSVNNSYYINQITILLFSVLLVFHITSKNFLKEKCSKSIIFIVFYEFYIILFILLNNVNGTMNFLFTFAVFFPIVYFLYSTSRNNELVIELLEKIPRIMFILSLISLVLYILGSLTNFINPNGSLMIAWGKERSIPSYFGLHFNTQTVNIFGQRFVRNSGIFTEAPMFSLNLTIALLVELFICQKKSNIIRWILFFTILTTTSTIGIIIASIVLILKILLNSENSKIKKILKILLFPIILTLLTYMSIYFLNARLETVSYSTRLDDYKAGYLAWKDHIMIGNGFNNNIALQKYMSSFRKNNQGLSNSIMVVLAQTGIYLFIIYLIPMFRGIRYGMQNSNMDIIIFTSVMIVLFIAIIFQYRYMLINFLAIGFAIPLNKKKKI